MVLKNISKIAICVPIHGDSAAFQRALKSIDVYILSVCEERGLDCILLVSNSGSETLLEPYWHGQSRIIKVPNNFYWAGAVKTLFLSAQEYSPSHILLMNHDIELLPNSFINLIDSLPNHPDSIVSSVSLIKNSNEVENAGFKYTKYYLPFDNPFIGTFAEDLPREDYNVDALNGRFVLFPASVANPNFLMPSFVPHYFADTVLSAMARRSGFSLTVIPNSRIIADRSDTEFKQARERCDSLLGVFNCLFKPYSYRYIWGSFWGQIFVVDNIFIGVIVSTKYTTLRIIKSILQLIRILPIL
jgi:GT2 family glycosyltransferase